MNREYIDTLSKILIDAGATDIGVEYGGKHPRITYIWKGIPQFYVFPATPSDSYRGLLNASSNIRRLLGLQASTKRVGERRPRRVPSRVPGAAAVVGQLTLRSDWRDNLSRHAAVRPHIGARLDLAWVGLWAGCMEKVGGQSLLVGNIHG